MPAKKAPAKKTASENAAPKKATAKKAEAKPAKKATKSDFPVQPTMNIGLVGHVDHGKTTLTERLSGKWTDTHSEEVKRGITIRLGYADTTFYKTSKGEFSTKAKDADSKKDNEPILKVSFVDAPGHEALMATMLAGTTIMDGALLLIAANERCPQAQTREHLMAIRMAGVKRIIIVQNKIDLVTEERALKNYEQIKAFLKDTEFADAPIVPISAQRGVNVDLLIQTIIDHFPVPQRDASADPLMMVARSFDINKPGSKPAKLVGGVLGGALKQGVFKVGDRIELRPGRIFEEANQLKAEPLFAKVTGTVTGGTPVEQVGPGGSIALMTTLDPGVV
ncbi:translation initiation factor IF-2 subunit gamma, partial [Candidatus Woesearchaeota archaeon]|nr:translation initiation factor IF-2 subunit gamma [Candidatus Woesearchaeota archaeon]